MGKNPITGKSGGPFGPAELVVYRWAWVESALQRVATLVLTGLLVWALVALLPTPLAPLVLLGLALIVGRGLLSLILRVFDPR